MQTMTERLALIQSSVEKTFERFGLTGEVSIGDVVATATGVECEIVLATARARHVFLYVAADGEPAKVRSRGMPLTVSAN